MADKVQEIIEKQVLTVAKAVEDKIDDEISALDRLDLDDIEVLRERRLQQMKKMAEKRSRWLALGHGEYSEIFNEKEFFTIVKASDRVVCHFFRENWPCKVVDRHLSILAKQHIETRFVKINAEKSPFLTEKLKIIVLPTIALIKNAKVDDYVVGFDELGGTDAFSTEELEERLAKAQVIRFEENFRRRNAHRRAYVAEEDLVNAFPLDSYDVNYQSVSEDRLDDHERKGSCRADSSGFHQVSATI